MDGDQLSEAEELLRVQRERERLEQARAQEALDDHEAREHQRRSEKAQYLGDKLQERVDSEADE